ncbi:enolase C-terminal domain-like protein [Gemmatimonas sp.]|uniref:enolase C-terminal domain-like protein n=1 Tax=Gemmatimonas sp. TaxID=1962908 RepID=UPI003566B991
MSDEPTIARVRVATVRADLPAPVVFGEWIMQFREYAVVRIDLSNGVSGWSFTLTRDGAVAEQVRKALASVYANSRLDDREQTFLVAQRRSLASNSAGIGLRALSLLDLAAWDAAARCVNLPIAEYLGHAAQAMPATAIVGYPPALMGPVEVKEQVAQLTSAGWRRFKLPVALTPELSGARLRAARSAAPDAWIGCDAAWTYDNVDDAVLFLESIRDVSLGWFEDVFPPGDAHKVAELRQRGATRIAMGDEQGGSYYPQALLDNNAVDVVRVDLTCMGGITGGRAIVAECRARDVEVAPHMFAHVHSQVFSGWGMNDAPIEWGAPWTGVDPYADSLQQPLVDSTGRMAPLPQSPGFGELVNRDWIQTQYLDDPEGIMND